MKYAIVAAALVVLVQPAAAIAPDASPRPHARGQVEVTTLARPKPRPVQAAAAADAPAALPARPKLRPPSEQERAMERIGNAQIVLASSAAGALRPQSLWPQSRPDGLAEKVMAQRQKRKREQARGSICGDLAIQGEAIGNVPGRIKGCGIENAVRVRSVAGVTLSQAATIDCTTARALKTWVEQGAIPAVGNRGGGLSSLKIAAHYACRTRNNQPGGRISEHGRGRAVDISALVMKDGSSMTVLKGWRSKAHSRPLKSMHRAACGPFGTVLGPNADRFHQDHFHFDTARYRSGSYCR